MEDELINFEKIERDRYNGLCFIKRVALCSFAEILFRRKLLPKEAFKTVKLKYVPLIVFDGSHDEGYENLIKIKEICDGIEKEVVKTLRLLVVCPQERKEKVGEIFELGMTYGDNVTISVKLGEAVEHIRYDQTNEKVIFRTFIMRLRTFCRFLNSVPTGSYGRYHVVYESDKALRECGESDLFETVVGAPPIWKGPKQEISGVVGIFNRRQIGMKMSVGTIFGSAATDPLTVAEHLSEDNWKETEWEDLRVYTKKRYSEQQKKLKPIGVTYKRKASPIREQPRKVLQIEPIQETRTKAEIFNPEYGLQNDVFEFMDEYEGERQIVPVDEEMRSLEVKEMGSEKGRETEKAKEKEGEVREIKKDKKKEDERKRERNKKREREDRRREKEKSEAKLQRRRTVEETKKTKDDKTDEGEEGNSADRAVRGSSIDSTTVLILGEEAKEKEGRMEKRRKLRESMEIRRQLHKGDETPSPRRIVSIEDIDKLSARTPEESTVTSDSGASIYRTPGICKQRHMGKDP